MVINETCFSKLSYVLWTKIYNKVIQILWISALALTMVVKVYNVAYWAWLWHCLPRLIVCLLWFMVSRTMCWKNNKKTPWSLAKGAYKFTLTNLFISLGEILMVALFLFGSLNGLGLSSFFIISVCFVILICFVFCVELQVDIVSVDCIRPSKRSLFFSLKSVEGPWW